MQVDGRTYIPELSIVRSCYVFCENNANKTKSQDSRLSMYEELG